MSGSPLDEVIRFRTFFSNNQNLNPLEMDPSDDRCPPQYQMNPPFRESDRRRSSSTNDVERKRPEVRSREPVSLKCNQAWRLTQADAVLRVYN